VHLSQNLKSVFIGSIPKGLAVLIDGRPSGHTPVTLRLSPGKHTVTVIRGEEQQEKLVEITDTETDIQVVDFSWAEDTPTGTASATPQ
jgi:hypothetical protein